MRPSLIISFDPSINNTGYALGQDSKILNSGVIKTKVEDGWGRLAQLSQGIKKTIGKKGNKVPELAIVEIPGTFTYARTANYKGKSLNQMQMQKLNMAVGVVLLTLTDWGIPFEVVEAHLWKGGRHKEMDMLLARQHTGKQTITHDEADAIMLCVWKMLQRPTRRCLYLSGDGGWCAEKAKKITIAICKKCGGK